MNDFSQIRYKSASGGTGGGPGGFLARIVGLIVALLVLGASVFVGAVFLAALVGLMLIVGVIVALRMWWLRRKMEQYQREHGDLDAEYTVIREERRDNER